MSASPSECRDRRDEIIEAIREAGMDQDPGPLMQVPGLVEDAVNAGCIDAADGEAIVEAVRDLGDTPTVSAGQPIRKRVRAAFADSTQDFGDLQAQRDEQTTLGEPRRPQRRQVDEGARREEPEQGQVQFGERGELRGQEQLGGGFAGPRPEREEDEEELTERERERRRTEGVRSLKKFVEGEGEGPPPGEAAPPEREKREWTESQDRATADKHYSALHFEGSVSVADTRRLLNKFQDAGRIIHLAKTSPATLRSMQGIGERTIEKLAALDPDEVIKTPRERGTSEAKLREAGIGPEGEGLGGFGDEGGGGGGGGGGGNGNADEDEDVTITMRDPETGESTTLEIPREVNGWRYEPDAPGSRGTVVWTPPGEPDRYVSIQKTGGHTWAAIHEDRTDVEPGEPPEDDVFKTSRTGAGALDDAIAMMQQRELGAGGAGDDVDVEAVAARALRAAAEALREQDRTIRGEHETTHRIAFHAASEVNEDSPATGDTFDAVEDLYGDAINEVVYREGDTGAFAAAALEDRADELDRGAGDGDSGNG